MARTSAATEGPVILFDGVCNLCNSFVNFVMDHDGDTFRFASIQSDVGSEFMRAVGLSPDDLETFVVVDGDDVYTKSTAALTVFRELGRPYSLLYPLVVLPSPVRDPIYEFVAAHRYDWFGKRDRCRMPTEETKERFLSEEN